MKNISILAIAAAAAILPASASAEALDQEAKSVKVRYADLDLSIDAGHAALERRIRSAAKEVCPNDGIGRIETQRFVVGCQSQALEGAMAQVVALGLQRRGSVTVTGMK